MAQFTNQASLSYNGTTANSNIVTGEVTQVISMDKNAVSSTYQSGDEVTYVVTLRNAGTTAFSNLTLSDNLGAYTFGTGTLTPMSYTGDAVLYYVNGVLQSTPTVTAGPPLTVSGLSIPAGGDIAVVYRARLNEFAPLGADASLTNTVTLTGDGLTAAVTASEAITTADEAELSITKAVSPATVPENGTLTYTFTISNTGRAAADATSDIVFSDQFNPILNNISVTLNGAAWASTGHYTYDTSTGVFTSTAGEITVPAATYTQDASTGAWSVTPGVTTLEISGTV